MQNNLHLGTDVLIEAKKSSKDDDIPAILKRIQTAALNQGHTPDSNTQGRLSFKRAFATKIGSRDAAMARTSLLRKLDSVRYGKPGKMYLFHYDAKHKDTLPIWDSYPLIFVIETYKDGFLGLNMHFVPPLVRQRIFVAFLKNAMLNRKDEIMRLRLDYKISLALAGTKVLQPTIKRYLFSQLRSPIKLVPSEYWEDILFLPFQKMNVNQRKK